MKKVTAVFLALVIAVTTFVFPSGAATKTSKVWNGKVSTSWYTGNKTSYDIDTPAELAGLAKLVNSGKSMKGITINLTADIVLNDTDGWKDWYNNPPENVFTPIGKTGNPVGGYYPFCGVFNGNGHTISGLYVKNETIAGLFGYLYCAGVVNVIIDKSVIIGYDNCSMRTNGVYTGAIAGIAEGSVINQCENNGLVYSVGDSREFRGDRFTRAGGIVGSLHTENLTQAVVAGAFAAGGIFYNAAIFNDGSGGLIKESGVVNCINYGTVTAINGLYNYSGGIVGYGNNGQIMNCLMLSSAVTKGADIKGYSGKIAGGLYICPMKNCYYWSDDGKKKGVGKIDYNIVTEVTDNAVNKTTEEVCTKSFIKKLGTSFVFVDRPYLACDRRVSDSASSSTSSSSSTPAVTIKNGKATIKWNAVDEAESYIVYKKQSNGKYKKLIATEKTKITIKNVKDGTTYELLIKAVYEDGSKKTIKNGKFSFTA